MTSSGYLVDTHVLLWDFAADKRLSSDHSELLRGNGRKFFSIASIWEIAIKSGIGKLTVPADLMEALQASAIEILPISVIHALHVQSLPHHHNDPFDRLLVAQAQLEGLTILTADRAIARYDLAVL